MIIKAYTNKSCRDLEICWDITEQVQKPMNIISSLTTTLVHDLPEVASCRH